MSNVNGDEIARLLSEHARLWNANSYEEWKQTWIDAVPGEMTLESPVGSPLRTGWDECWGRAYERFAGSFRLDIDQCIVCGDEAVAVVGNRARSGEDVGLVSIEHYHFFADGRLEMRHFWDASSVQELLSQL